MCAKMAKDDWWCSIDSMMAHRNKNYEATVCASDMIRHLIEYSFAIDVELFADTFDCKIDKVRLCIKETGLKYLAYKTKYDAMFGKNAWNEGNGLEADSDYDDLIVLPPPDKKQKTGEYDSDFDF